MPFFLEGVIYFSVTFPACKAITENGRRHHKYANCCQLTGFAGSALGSGIAAAGGIRGARPPLRAPSAAEPPPAPAPPAPRRRPPPRLSLGGAPGAGLGRGHGGTERAPLIPTDSRTRAGAHARSRGLFVCVCVCVRAAGGFSASVFLSRGGRESSSFARRSAGSSMPPLSHHTGKIFVPPSAHLRGAPRRGVGKGLAHPPPRREFFTYPGKSGDARVWSCSLKHMPRPSLF